MTDDFELFQDTAGDHAMDADIALITAYLARELSPVQIVAVEERLTNDKTFREKVNPILEAWVLPTALTAVPAGQGPLSRDQVEAGWQRYVGEHAELDAHEGPRLVVEGAQRKRRKISMTRIAAGIAAIVLPVFALAQVVVYVAKHQDAPGHVVAKRVVAPFVEPPPAVTPTPQAKTPPKPVDVPVGRQLETGRTSVQRAATVTVPPIDASASVVIPPPTGNPDRVRIMALAKKHMPEVVRGDTNVSYAVMVLDASDDYVWGTYGTGAVQLVVGGDTRTPAQRAESSFKYMREYMGLAPGARMGAGAMTGSGVVSGFIFADSGSRIAAGRGGRGGGIQDTTSRAGDSVYARLSVRRDSISQLLQRVDSAMVGARGGGARGGGGAARVGGGGGARGGAAGVGVARGGGGGTGAGGFILRVDSGAYGIAGGARARSGQTGLNTAAGLQEPARGESGIQGLAAASLTMGETYRFAPGQLTPQPLSIMVVHLARGTSWTGR